MICIQGGRRERLVSGSDDFTLFLWDPEESKKPLARMTGQIIITPQLYINIQIVLKCYRKTADHCRLLVNLRFLMIMIYAWIVSALLEV